MTLSGVMIRWTFQGNFFGHAEEDDLEWGNMVSMESRTINHIIKTWPKVATKKEEMSDPEALQEN